MRVRGLLIIAFAMTGVVVAAVFGYKLTQTPETEPAPIKDYEKNLSQILGAYMEKGDSNGDGKLNFDEFKVRYRDQKLDKSARETFTDEEAFRIFDHNHDQVLDTKDVEYWARVDRNAEIKKTIEEDAEAGLVAMAFNGKMIKANPFQKDWINAETSYMKTDCLPYSGAPLGFPRKYFQKFARVTFADGTSVQGFVREGDGSEAAKKDELANDRVYVLTNDRKLSVFDRAKVQAIEYTQDSPQLRFVQKIADPKLMLDDVPAHLELARQCIKDGMKDDALSMYRRVLIFQFDNDEALKAMGLKLNGRHYIMVK